MNAGTLSVSRSPEITPSQFAQFAAAIKQRLGADEILVLTTMPRGGLQVCRRLAIHESLVRRYVTELHKHDALVWRTIRQGVVAASDPALELDQGGDTPIAYGLTTTLAVRVESPVFSGYPGVVLILRGRHSDVLALDAETEAAEVRELFDGHLRSRPARPGITRQFVFANDGTPLVGGEALNALDPQFADGIRRFATSGSGRHLLADHRGVATPVEVVSFDHYPALGKGPVTFVSIQPEFADWASIDATTFEADPELTRLTQAIAFIVEHYSTSPTLDAIAASVQLSQFHFHRRFSELFGITPKHLLYDLQLNEAKRLVADPSHPLSQVAKLCGFAHQSHFTSRFKQGVGVTPTRWRRLQAPAQ